MNWTSKIKKLTSIRHRATILRIAHGEIYTKARLYRFGLIESPNCVRCGEIETLEHKIYECDYVKRIWKEICSYTDKFRLDNVRLNDLETILVAHKDVNTASLTAHCETLQRILGMKEADNFLLHPKFLAKSIMQYIIRTDRDKEVVSMLKSVID